MNITWAATQDEIAYADEQPWDGPLSRLVRQLPYDAQIRLWGAGLLLYVFAGLSALLVGLTFGGISEGNRIMLALLGGLCGVISAVMAAALLLATPLQLRRYTPLASVILIPLCSFWSSACLLAAGSSGDILIVVYAEAPIFAVYVFRGWFRLGVLSLAPLLYGGVLLAQPENDNVVRWIVMASTVASTAIGSGGISARAELRTQAERDARVELAGTNQDLEAQVSEQVAQIAHLAELSRFLAPHIAEAVARQDSERLFQPHRRKVAVFFCDLRGFTAFTNTAQPEDVFEVLDEYYKTVGTLLRSHGATIAQYTGDGIMAFFGDPIPIEEPALAAVRMADELRTVMDPVVARWRKQGYELGHGVAVTYGYATLGLVGSEGRLEYVPLGSIVNLAARICDKAKAGEVLLDQATHAATHDTVPSTFVGSFDLKGFPAETKVFGLDAGEPDAELQPVRRLRVAQA